MGRAPRPLTRAVRDVRVTAFDGPLRRTFARPVVPFRVSERLTVIRKFGILSLLAPAT